MIVKEKNFLVMNQLSVQNVVKKVTDMQEIKLYTDLSQSKTLSKILPLESADMFYNLGESQLPNVIYGNHNDFKCYLPCWSLAALMNLLPSEFTEKGKYSETTYKIDIRKYALTEGVDLYQIAYGNYKFHEDGNTSWKDMINTGEKEDLIDAVFQMICWLKENNKL